MPTPSTTTLIPAGDLLAGSFVAAWLSGELRVEVLRGPRMTAVNRLVLALTGGVIEGRGGLARGCTSGQGLVGGAEPSSVPGHS